MASTVGAAHYIDVAQVVLYAFWIFFAGLIYYLLKENKREGYPLDSDRSDRAPRVEIQGFPRMPKPKTYLLAHGGTAVAPDFRKDRREIHARPTAGHPGAALEPTGDPLRDGVGPAAYAERSDTPDLTIDGVPRIVPMRVAGDFSIAARDDDPRGLPVIGADGGVAGTVRDVWVDRSEVIARYYEVELHGVATRVLLPVNFSVIVRQRIEVAAILAQQFAGVPALRSPDQVTRLEEDRIMGYYGGGTLYATPSRMGPVL